MMSHHLKLNQSQNQNEPPKLSCHLTPRNGNKTPSDQNTFASLRGVVGGRNTQAPQPQAGTRHRWDPGLGPHPVHPANGHVMAAKLIGHEAMMGFPEMSRFGTILPMCLVVLLAAGS
jgi:hypothetical protein